MPVCDVQVGPTVERNAVMEKSRQFTADGERHKVFKKGDQVWVDHVDIDRGKHDKVNLTKHMGARTVAAGTKAVKDYHSGKGPSYYDKGAKK